MLPLVLVTLLAQGPSSSPALIITRRTGVTPADAERFAADAAAELNLRGVTLAEPPAETARKLTSAGIDDPTSCAGSRECVGKLGAVLKRAAVISFEVGEVGGELAMHLELVRAQSGERLAELNFLSEGKPTPKSWAVPLRPFATQVRAAISTLPPEDVPRAEHAPQLTPEPRSTVIAEEPKTTRAPAYAFAAGGTAAAAASIAFFAIATHQRNALFGEPRPDGTFAPSYSRSESEARADTYSRNYGIAAASAGTAMALGVATWLFWPKEAP